MKIWIIGKNSNSNEYLYLRITNNMAKELAFTINESAKLKFYKFNKSDFDGLIKQYGSEIYIAKIETRGSKYIINQVNEYDLFRNSFIRDENLKLLPKTDFEKSKLDIIKDLCQKFKYR